MNTNALQNKKYRQLCIKRDIHCNTFLVLEMCFKTNYKL